MVKRFASSLHNGQSFNYTKMYNQYVIKMGFPTAMGLPFVYSLQVPTLMAVGGEAQLKSHPDLASGSDDEIQPPKTLNLTAEIKMTYVYHKSIILSFWDQGNI